MARDMHFACRCGALAGTLRDMEPSAFTHIRCHCRDCRAAYTHLGHADPDAVGILQTSQDRVSIDRGGENLRVFRHSPRGALRWYATCCDTPLFYTPLKARLVHVGVNADVLSDDDDPGRVQAEGYVPDGKGGTRHKGAARMVGRMVPRMLSGNLSGSWRDTPFFADDGAPAVPPHVLTREQRAAALMGVKA
ncbi:DUF6151 family protein [Jannaschia sp. LMIT008]|uniref:DUF6151 family protein n=1 Tax=Jannaschia maritima TaxID=3032585 RepID=UPI0028125741|nr:DUF6151 family protein [Jannaschia sp. LMIT008]